MEGYYDDPWHANLHKFASTSAVLNFSVYIYIYIYLYIICISWSIFNVMVISVFQVLSTPPAVVTRNAQNGRPR